MKAAVFLFLIPAITLAAEERPAAPPFPPLEQTLTDAALFSKPLQDVQIAYRRELTPSQQAERAKFQAKMKEKGVDIGDGDPSGFQWLSASHDGLRAEPKKLKLFGEPVGEVVIRGSAGGKVGPVTVSLYNRGDDGDLAPSGLKTRTDTWKARVDQALGVRSEARDQRGAVNVTGWMWKKDRVAWLLEASTSKAGGSAQAEFLRLRIASIDAASGGAAQTARRIGLTDHVARKDNGDVVIEGVPMVDQGQKGYCAVATTERVARYYGLEVDQYEMAQLANTGQGGTSMQEMEEALKRVTGKLHVRTTKQYELEDRQFIQDVKSYNQLAKKAGEREFLFERNVSIVNPMEFWAKANPEIFLEMKTKQSGFDRFTGRIHEYVDQGIPLCWALRLGMFKEEGIPQTSGGHMRLIIGYNEKTKEILYSDSWGKGHELKRMPAGNAWCMTMALYTMAPTK